MIIQRVFCFPSPWTFRIKPIRQLVLWYMHQHGGIFIDPFAGYWSPAHIRNDIDPVANAHSHLHATEFIENLDTPFNGVLFDPPYSPTQVKETYERLGTKGILKDFQSWSPLKKKLLKKHKNLSWQSVVVGIPMDLVKTLKKSTSCFARTAMSTMTQSYALRF